SQPDQSRYHSDLGRSYNILGYLHDEARDNGAAIPAFQRAVVEQGRAVSASPDVDEYKDELSSELDNLGEQFVDLGQVADALPHYRRALDLRRELLRTHKASREYTIDL